MFKQRMPRNVVWFERIAYLAWALSVIQCLFEWKDLMQSFPGETAWVGPAVLIPCIVAEAWWIWLIARRRKNWARWISVVVLVLVLPGYYIFLKNEFQNAPAHAPIALLGAILWYVPFCFLFVGDAPAWFKPQPQTPTEPDPPQ
jgi:hypothetical protein